MKNKNDVIKKAFDLYAYNESLKLPADNQIDFNLSEETERKIKNINLSNRPHFNAMIRWSALAASLLIVINLILFIPSAISSRTQPDTSSDTSNQDDKKTLYPVTTDVGEQELTPYKNIDELLEYLGENEVHEPTLGEVYISGVSGNDVQKVKFAVNYDRYCYSIYKNPGTGIYSLITSVLFKEFTLNTDVITDSENNLCGLYIQGKKLYVIYADKSERSNENYYTGVYIYDLSDPAKPALIKTIEQNGSLSASYMNDGMLYIYSSDGVCACGYSHLDDKSKYIPAVRVNGENINIPDENIYILSSPKRICYLTLTVIDMQTAELKTVKAFYTDVVEYYYGANYIAFNIRYFKKQFHEASKLYLFSISKENVTYNGKVSLAKLFGFPEIYDVSAKEYSFIDISNVFKVGDTFRIFASYYINKSENMHDYEKGYIIVLIDSNMHVRYLIGKEEMNLFFIDEIDNEENRAIITLSLRSNGDINNEAYLVVVDFSKETPAIYENKQLILSRMTNRDDALFKYSDNIYLRYNYTHFVYKDKYNTYATTGIDILDFSDMSKIKYIYQAPASGITDLIDESIPLYRNQDIFGVKKQNVDTRMYRLEIFKIDVSAKKPFKKITTINLSDDYFYYQYEIIKYADEYYYVPCYDTLPQWLQF